MTPDELNTLARLNRAATSIETLRARIPTHDDLIGLVHALENRMPLRSGDRAALISILSCVVAALDEAQKATP